MKYTKQELTEFIKGMGIEKNDCVMIHSSVKSMGDIDGGADTVIDAFMEYLTEGMLMMPTHTWKQMGKAYRVFDRDKEPVCVGILPEIFRKREGVFRSLHPTHSMAVYGKGARQYIAGEEKCGTPCTPGGCWQRLEDIGAKILLIGIGHEKNTFIHAVEETMNVPERFTDEPELFYIKYREDGQDKLIERPMYRHYNRNTAHISEAYVKLTDVLYAAKAAHKARFADAECIVCDAKKSADVIRQILSKEINCLMDREASYFMESKNVIDVRSFGAVGDGKTINTAAIQSAIDSCKAGDMVLISDGVYLSGALFLKENMTLCVEEGAKILGSTDLKDYPIMKYSFEGNEQDCYASLINSKNIEKEKLKNICIMGKGVIDANGKVFFEQLYNKSNIKRGRAVCLRNVDGVELKDITIRQSPSWCLHLIYCNNINIDNVKVYTKTDENGNLYDLCNGDGIDIDSCKDVVITNSLIDSEDDCIAVKSGRDKEGRDRGIPSENILIQNCVFSSGFGVAIGSEMSGGVRNVLVKDCVFNDTYSISSVKAPRGRGGVIEHITYENCKHINRSKEHKDCRWFRGALYIDQFYSHDTFDYKTKEEVTEATPTIRDIVFSNVSVDTTAGNAIFLAGLAENPLQDICLKHVRAKGKYGLKAYQIKNLVLEDVIVEAEEGENIEMDEVNFANSDL